MTAYALDLTKRHDDFINDYKGRASDPSNLKLFIDINTKDKQEIKPESVKRFKSVTTGLMYLANVRVDILQECIVLSMCSNKIQMRQPGTT